MNLIELLNEMSAAGMSLDFALETPLKFEGDTGEFDVRGVRIFRDAIILTEREQS